MKKFSKVYLFGITFILLVLGQYFYKKLNYGSEIADVNTISYFENLFLKTEMQTLDNKLVRTTDLKAPVVIINFWATWCLPCLEEIPSMRSLKQKFPDSVLQIISINTDMDDQDENIRKIMYQLKLNKEFIVVPDRNMKIMEKYKVSAVPMTMIFNRGKMVYSQNGQIDFNSVEFISKIKKWATI